MANYVYAIAVAQFLLGAVIAVLNLMLLLAVASSAKLRTAPHCFLSNMWFANLLLGIIVSISNVVDTAGIYVFQKTEGTISIVNGFVTVSMLLALTTNRVVSIRNPTSAMSAKTSYSIIIATWVVIMCLTLVKAIVYGLDKIGTVDACFRCFLSFEVSTLVIFAVATLVIYFVSIYLLCTRRNRTVADSAIANANTNATAHNGQKEYQMTLTIGLLLSGFSLTFLAFIFLIPAWLTNGDSIDADAAEIIVTLFYTHCLINPVIILIRDKELRNNVRSILRCKHPGQTHEPHAQPPNELAQPITHELIQHDQGQEIEGRVHENQNMTNRVVYLPSIENPTRKSAPENGESQEVKKEHRNAEGEEITMEQMAPTAPPIEKTVDT